ncbi:hypothetical protein AB0B30_33350 [Streptomyces narbonensis]|uniref:Uncharacterized protein n=1 Tax=Streptomyces narbonensis TaxID=67333 RepID=A0ABV3CL20_9ACTN
MARTIAVPFGLGAALILGRSRRRTLAADAGVLGHRAGETPPGGRGGRSAARMNRWRCGCAATTQG